MALAEDTRIELCGPLAVRYDERPLEGELPGRQGRLLLAYLAVHRDRAVARDELIELLWPVDAPVRAGEILSALLAKLRRVLGPATIEGRGALTLHLSPGAWIDLEAATAAAEAAERALAASAWERALGSASAGLEVTGRDFLCGEAHPWVDDQRRRVAELRMRCLEALAAAGVRLGGSDLATAERAAREMTEAAPFNETGHRLLMEVLAARGSVPEALEAFDRLRVLLRDELGITPGPAARELHRALLLGGEAPIDEKGLEPPRAGGAPPAPVTPLIGRVRELADTRALLTGPDARLLTLTGAGGTGKTRLAVELARSLLDEFEYSVFFVELARIREVGLVAEAIARALGVRENGGRPALERIQDALSSRRALIVLDNLEHLPDAALVVGGLLGAAPHVKVLATSRVPLRVAGEHEYLVPPLTLPDDLLDSSAADAARSSAVALFVARARAVRADFELDDGNVREVVEICARLDGLPLAIELAAARLRSLSPAALLDRLGTRLSVLTGGPRDAPERLRALRSAIDWSHDLLDEPQRALLRRLSVFVGGASLDTIPAVAGGSGDEASLDAVAALVDQSLLVRDEGPGREPRFRMMETIREYAQGRLAEGGEDDTVRDRHLAAFVALAEEAEPGLRGPSQASWLARLDAEQGNLRAALARSAAGDPEPGLRIAAALWRYWQIRGHSAEGRERVERLLARPLPAGAHHVRARAQSCAARLAWFQGDRDSARELIAASLETMRAVGDEAGTAFCIHNLGQLEADGCNYSRAVDLFEDALGRFEGAGEVWATAMPMQYLAEVARVQGDYPRARMFAERALATARSVGDTRTVGYGLLRLGAVAVDLGEDDEGRRLLEESAAIGRSLGDSWTMPTVLTLLGMLAARAGDDATGHRLLVEGMLLRRDVGDRPGLADSLARLAVLAESGGDLRRAATLHGSAAASRAASGAPLHGVDAAVINESVDRLSASLGVAFSPAFAGGEGASLEDALAYASEPAASC